jgi:phosphinothricin acetyltransferase
MTDASASAWYRSHQKTLHPLLVAEVDNGVVGYGSLSLWSTKDAYGRTSEVSVFVNADHHRKGAGSALLDALLGAAREVGHRCLIARIEAGNRPSIELFRGRGFTTVGVMHDAGFKFGRWLNVEIMERLVDHRPAAEGGV